MFDLKKEWSISFAGCGFMGIYYVGASSCILERFPRFIQDASKIYGASAGALTAAVLTVGIPLDKCCADLILMAKEARKRKLGPLHPAFNLLQLVKEFLAKTLPEDAHVRASGKLCVSLTRVSNGKNVLVSEFNSREELIEALICSCFVPFYCGVIPPTYRGVHYVDGAVSDNLPRCHLMNTTTISPYAGESDLCPRSSTLTFNEVRFNNVSIQVNSENLYRVTSTFFPPEPQASIVLALRGIPPLSETLEGLCGLENVTRASIDIVAMAEICHSGYMDALRFLQENNLISSECPLRSLQADAPKPACCELANAEAEQPDGNTRQKGLKPPQGEHCWLNAQLIQNLPVNIKKVLCKACRETHTAGGLFSQMSEYLPKTVTSYLQIPRILPVESACSLAQRIVDWIPDVPGDMRRLYGKAGDVYKQAWKGKAEEYVREKPLRRSSSLPSDLNLWHQRKEDMDALPMTPEATPTSSLTFSWNTHSDLDHMSLTPPPTPTFSPTSGFGEAATELPESASRGWGLSKALGWIRNIASDQTSNVNKTDDSMSFFAFK